MNCQRGGPASLNGSGWRGHSASHGESRRLVESVDGDAVEECLQNVLALDGRADELQFENHQRFKCRCSA